MSQTLYCWVWSKKSLAPEVIYRFWKDVDFIRMFMVTLLVSVLDTFCGGVSGLFLWLEYSLWISSKLFIKDWDCYLQCSSGSIKGTVVLFIVHIFVLNLLGYWSQTWHFFCVCLQYDQKETTALLSLCRNPGWSRRVEDKKLKLNEIAIDNP